jgi:hypothetical protein
MPRGSVFMPFAYVEAAANILTNPEARPVRQDPRVQVLRGPAGPGVGRRAGAIDLRRPLDFVLLAAHPLGIGLAASGACGLNEYVEWRRTGACGARRAGRSRRPDGAADRAVLLQLLVGLGLLHLAALREPDLTTALVALTLVSYVFLYTPLKRRTWLATLVGAVPGALPILAGWTAGGGGITRRASPSSASCSSGRCRTSTRSPGSTARTTRAAGSA